jgi:hypothetical protein
MLSFKYGNEVIVATAGSAPKDFGEGGDTFELQHSANNHYQFTDQYTKELKQKYGSSVTMSNTGHSLGGGSAAYAANEQGSFGQSIGFDSKDANSNHNSVNYDAGLSIIQRNNGKTQIHVDQRDQSKGWKAGHYIGDLFDDARDDSYFIDPNRVDEPIRGDLDKDKHLDENGKYCPKCDLKVKIETEYFDEKNNSIPLIETCIRCGTKLG